MGLRIGSGGGSSLHVAIPELDDDICQRERARCEETFRSTKMIKLVCILCPRF